MQGRAEENIFYFIFKKKLKDFLQTLGLFGKRMRAWTE
jgi:hypothetical protein